VEVEGNEIKKKETLVPPPHEPGVLPDWLHHLGADVIIAGGMGQRAISLFGEKGIIMNGEFLGVPGGCGYVLGSGEVDTFMVYKTIGIAEERLMNQSDDIPVMTSEQAESHTRFIQSEIKQILKDYKNGL